MSDQSYFYEKSRRMARKQAALLVAPTGVRRPDSTPQNVAELIDDCVGRLDLQDVALDLVVSLHPIMHQWTDWRTWDSAIERVATLDDAHVPPAARARLLVFRSHTARLLDKPADGLQLARQALALARSIGDRGLIAEAYGSLGVIEMVTDHFNEAREYLAHAEAIGRDRLPDRDFAHILMNLGWVLLNLGDIDRADGYLIEAAARYRQADDQVGFARAEANRAELLRRTGHAEAAIEMLIRARDQFSVSGARYDVGLVWNTIGYAYMNLERWHDALTALDMALREFRDIRSLNGQAWVQPNIAELYVTTGRWHEATRALDYADELAALCERPLISAAIAVDRGRMHYALGQFEDARRQWEQAVQIQEAHGKHDDVRATRRLLATIPDSDG